jgi:hypothetical protein
MRNAANLKSPPTPELKNMLRSVQIPYVPGEGHWQPGNEDDFAARRIQNNIIREYIRNTEHREPNDKEVLSSYNHDPLPPGTYYGTGYTLKDNTAPSPPAPPKPSVKGMDAGEAI